MPLHSRRENIRYRILLTRLLLAVLAGVTVTGCATLEQMVQKPTAVFSGMRITGADLVKSTAVFSFDIRNPNPINLRAGRITYDLKLNGRNFVNGNLDQGLTVPAGGTSRLQVPVTMAYLDFFDSMAQLWSSRSADYALTGGIAVGPLVIPFQAHGVLDLPEIPKLSLQSIEVEKLSLSGATLQCRVQMSNPNAFDLLFKKMDYTLRLGDASLGRASSLAPAAISKNGKSTVTLAFDLSFAQLGRSAFQLLKGSKADYKLDGGLIFDQPNGEGKVPFSLSGIAPLLHR